MHVRANGIVFRYEIDGPEGAPWLVFSNSLATDLSMWEPQVAELRGAFRLLRYDQRGHGGTEAPPGRYSFDQLVDDAVTLLDALAIGRVHFSGLSMGGATALGLALRQPERVGRVIVADSPCASSQASARQWEERIAIAAKDGMEPLVEATIQRWFSPQTLARNPPHLDKVRAMIRATPVAGFIGCAAALADHDYASQVASAKSPVLFIAGANDGANPAAMSKLHGALPGSRYVELQDAGHISNLDQPAAFTRAIADFLHAG